MISWFARNHVAANLLMISIFVAGLLSLKGNIPLEVFPSTETNTINIAVSLRGATPEDIEQGVSIRIEEAVQDLEGIEQLTSRSMEGTSLVTVEVEPGYDSREILADVKSRVDAISTLPSEAENPVISLTQHKFGVITVAVAGDLSEREIREIGEQTRDDLLRLPEITQAELSAVRDYEINITIPQDRLRNYQLTLEKISAAIQNHSLDFSAGNVRSEGGDVLIRSKGQAYQRDEFEAIVVKTNPDGSILRLGDIADVQDGFTEDALKTRFNGKPAALVDVYRIGDQSALKVAEAVRQYIDQRQSTLPKGLELSYWDDDSVIVKNRLGTLVRNAVQGGILVLALLTLFLRPAIAFWVFLGVPISFMGAFIFMPVLGVSLNILSLFGFILVLGIVVDDAIVTGENVYTHLRTSETGLEAAIRGTKEVAIPVTFGVLTTIVAFMPFTFVEGRRGVLFAQLAMVVIPVLLFSLIESKFILPAHLKHVRLNNGREGASKRLSQWQKRFADGFEQLIIRYYRPLLEKCIHQRYNTLVLFSGVLIVILAIIMSGWTRFVFFPNIAAESASATLTFPTGTPLEVTDRYVAKMESTAKQLQDKYEDPLLGKPLIVNVLSVTGAAGFRASGSHLGQVRFELIPAESRTSPVTVGDLVREWRDLIGPVPGAESLIFRSDIGRPNTPVDVQLSGTSLAILGEVAEKIKARLTTYPTVFDITDSLSDGKEELQVELTEQGLALGLTRRDIILQVGRAFKGFEAQRVQRGRDDVRVL
ncbi:MAG: efflux RND transporter permease subunit, partial [Pseudomonadales bacterium]|nr:efflux RND transporter permease subunit [Pseudomonadales bacterium]